MVVSYRAPLLKFANKRGVLLDGPVIDLDETGRFRRHGENAGAENLLRLVQEPFGDQVHLRKVRTANLVG